MAGTDAFSSSVRRQAEDILSKAPYRTAPAHSPRPLAGLLHAIGRGLDWAFGCPARWLYHHAFVPVGHGFTGAVGGWWPLVLGVVSVGLGVMAGVLLVRRRGRIASRGPVSPVRGPGVEDPDDLERRASAAETEGDLEGAVRLRFAAGVLRLAQRGVVLNADAQTDRQISERLRSPAFDALAHRHEVIVYGGVRATRSDAAHARNNWPTVLIDVGQGERRARRAADHVEPHPSSASR